MIVNVRSWVLSFGSETIEPERDPVMGGDAGRAMKEADFYLASSEGYGLERPRACCVVKRLRGEKRDDFMLLSIEPPLLGQPYGLGNRDIRHVVLATRHQGDSLFPVDRWPAFVHVARLLVPYEGQDRILDAELEAIAWAELYETEEAAHLKRM